MQDLPSKKSARWRGSSVNAMDNHALVRLNSDYLSMQQRIEELRGQKERCYDNYQT